MDFLSNNADDNEAMVEQHLEDIKVAGFKKYVVDIDNQYVDLIDSMSVEERNEVINEIISLHNDNLNEKKQAKTIFKLIGMIIVSLIVLLFAAPGVFWVINKSFTLTKNNYSEMQNHFEVLYQNQTQKKMLK